jgi:hypothetical protein
MTDSQKQEAFMDKLFNAAKDDEEDGEVRDGKWVKREDLKPDDDDDW